LLYDSETQSLTMREERNLSVFKNSMLIIFETMMDEVIWEWIKLHKKEHKNLNSPPNMVGDIKFQKIRLLGSTASICKAYCLQAFGD
jgi:hypothetical protein